MGRENQRIQQAFTLFDAYNQQDPNTFVWEETSYPQEYFMGLKLHEWVLKLDPQANEVLLLASRCQHIGRWELARTAYPEGREGYLQWRKALAKHHATVATGILQKVGYEQAIIERVEDIILKRKLKVDGDVQTMENALCLVFLAYQYESFHREYPSKIVNILRKSLLKMDEKGHAFALKLSYSEEGGAYIQEALQEITRDRL